MTSDTKGGPELSDLDDLGRQEECLNCGAPRSEIFCQRCGQKDGAAAVALARARRARLRPRTPQTS